MEWMRYPADRVRLVLDRDPSRGFMSVNREQIGDHLTYFQELIELGRETLPQRTVEAARRALGRSAAALGLELVETTSPIPTFLLLPPGGQAPSLTVFGSWSAEAHPVAPAAAEGGERLALAASVGGLAAAIGSGELPGLPAMVVPPGAGHGSLVLEATLGGHRPSLQAKAAFWPRVGSVAPRRRRVFLGARGRVVFGLWGGESNPYTLRDRLVTELGDAAYGPRPLDFELLRKLAGRPDALEFLEEAVVDPLAGDDEDRLRNAMFAPIGHVAKPPTAHPDRPRAWITIEGAEDMDPAMVVERARALASDSRVEQAEGFRWDRLNLYHPSVQALIHTAKARSEGADIWPAAPWVTPSGLFTRALGTPLAEWTAPLPPGTRARAPGLEAYRFVVDELSELFVRGVETK
jgi:hypothetical protein